MRGVVRRCEGELRETSVPILHVGSPREAGDDGRRQVVSQDLRCLFGSARNVSNKLDDRRERNKAQQLGIGDRTEILRRIKRPTCKSIQGGARSTHGSESARQAADVQIRSCDAAGLITGEVYAQRIYKLDKDAALLEIVVYVIAVKLDRYRARVSVNLLQCRNRNFRRLRRIKNRIERRLIG